ncbi:MAG: glycosyltransferase [Algoriphagus sp.]|jgi:glycosyltransferase involved in cell wall biosynthesis|nr:glycosyltransferase [Algoriphagus sp.]
MEKQLISIIIASYNQEKFLNESLKSVYNQSYPNWECIIVDDCSTDTSLAIAKKWVKLDNRFKVFRLDSNSGLSAARNKGLLESKGNYIQFLDADDLLEENKLLNQLPYCESDLITVSGNRYFYHHEGPQKRRIIGKNGALPEVPITKWDQADVLELFKNKNPFVVTAPLYPRSVLDRVGMLNEDLRAFEDWEFNIRCALAGYKFHHVGYAEKAQALIRLHANSMTTNRSEMLKRRREFNFAISKNKDFQNYFGQTTSTLNRPVFQKSKTVLLSLIPPILIQLAISIRKR